MISLVRMSGAKAKASWKYAELLWRPVCPSFGSELATAKPTDITVMRERYGAFLDAQLEAAVRGTDPVVAHGVPGMMVWGAIFRADAHGNEAVVEARIRDLVA